MISKTYLAIYEAVKTIPKGRVASYGKIAALAGNPRWSQVVGWALHVNPDQSHIPCHRVVYSDGRICSGFAFGGPQVQRMLLESEGVEVTKNEGTLRVDMNRYSI